ncbi:MAG: TolC family protein [Peptococcaceae bacterium]
MKQTMLRRIAAITALVLGLAQIPAPVLAASSNITSSNVVSETQNKTTLTVSQVKDLAVLYNPTNKTYQLNQKNLDLNQTTTSNTLRSAQNSLNSSFDIDTSSVTALRAQIEELESRGELSAAEQEQLASLKQQLSQAEASVDAAYAASASSFESAISNIEQLNSTLDSYDDEQDDLDKTVQDWENQVRMIAEVLCMQVTQYDKNIALLEDQITLAEKSLNLAKVQQELGMALTTDVQKSQTSLEEARQSLETAKDNLTKVKRQINVLIGRKQDNPLEITPMSVPVIVSDVPTYSDALVKEITDKDYTLKVYDRTIANYKDDVDGETDSDVLQAADNKIEGVKLNIEERKRNLADQVKSQLAKMNTDKASYETSQKKVTTEKQNYEVAQKKYDLGMLTGSELLQAEISYQEAVVTHWKNSYNYYLDWQEYKAMQNGTDISTYSQYRM